MMGPEMICRTCEKPHSLCGFSNCLTGTVSSIHCDLCKLASSYHCSGVDEFSTVRTHGRKRVQMVFGNKYHRTRSNNDFRELTKSVTVVRNGMTRRRVCNNLPPAILPVSQLWTYAMLLSYRASARLQYTLFVVAIK